MRFAGDAFANGVPDKSDRHGILAVRPDLHCRNLRDSGQRFGFLTEIRTGYVLVTNCDFYLQGGKRLIALHAHNQLGGIGNMMSDGAAVVIASERFQQICYVIAGVFCISLCCIPAFYPPEWCTRKMLSHLAVAASSRDC